MENVKKVIWVNEDGELILVKTEGRELREMPRAKVCDNFDDVVYFESLCQQ